MNINRHKATLESYNKAFERLDISYDAKLLKEIAKSCGPSIFNNDASIVSSHDKTELVNIKNNFLIKKLGLVDSRELDHAIQDVIKMTEGLNGKTYRVVFYYFLVNRLDQSNFFLKQPSTNHSITKNREVNSSIPITKHLNKIFDEDKGLLKRLAR